LQYQLDRTTILDEECRFHEYQHRAYQEQIYRVQDEAESIEDALNRLTGGAAEATLQLYENGQLQRRLGTSRIRRLNRWVREAEAAWYREEN
jgi:hypothetical protein